MIQPRRRPHGTPRVPLVFALGLLLTAPLGAAAGTQQTEPAGNAADFRGFVASAQYRQAQEHARDVIDFEPGGAVDVPFTPRADDGWSIDGAAPRPLPAALATGGQIRNAPASRDWVAGSPEDAAEPWHFNGGRGASEALTAAAAESTGVVLASTTIPPAADGSDAARLGGNGLRREVFGFLPYWELSDRATVLDWRTLSTVAYFSVGCTNSGKLLKRNPDGSTTTGWAGWTSSRMSSVIDAAHEHQARVVLTVSCFAWTTGGAATQAALLGSAAARATLARQVAAAVRDRGADGVNLDFEPIAAGYGDQFTKLVRSVRAELNAIAPGYQLTFDTMGTLDNQPIAAATAHGGADAVVIMGYDYRTAAADVAGSISPLSGPEYDLNDTIKAFTAVVPPSKLILAVPWYGRAWSTPGDDPHAPNISGARNGHVAEPTYAQAFDLLSAFGRRWDALEASPWTAYRKQTCTPRYGCVTSWRELYVDDAASLGLRYDLVNRAGLRGVGIWALGFDGDHPELRAGLAAKFLSDRTPPVVGIVTLAPRQRDEGFRVAWTSYDQSAIRGYDVQVSIDGGRWETWLTGTTLSSAIYLGTNGRTYAFRVRGTDVHGNVSAWQSMPVARLRAPTSVAVGGFATVLTDGLRLRERPSTAAVVMTRLSRGDALRVIGGPVRGNGYTWFQVAGPVRQWGAVDSLRVGGWVAVAGNGETNVAPRSAAYATEIRAGITSLRLNGGGTRSLTANGDGIDDTMRLTWVNHRDLDALALRVYRSDGRFVGAQPLGSGKRAEGAHSFSWDGRIGGAPVTPGTYVLQLQGTEGSTTYSAASAAPVSAAQLARWGVVIGTVDRTPPSAGDPRVTLLTGAALASTAATSDWLATLTLSATDAGGAGVAGFDVRRSRDGGAFADVASGVTGSALRVSLASGHSYQFEVRARDRAGNVGTWTVGPLVRPALLQQTSRAIVYTGAWRLGESTSYSATFDRFSTSSGATALYTFTGRGVALVTTRGPDRGAVRIYLDGVLVATVDTNARALAFRSLVWSRTWSRPGTHTVKLVVVGTTGHPRVDLDALAILR